MRIYIYIYIWANLYIGDVSWRVWSLCFVAFDIFFKDANGADASRLGLATFESSGSGNNG